jgi:hypothetical protein
MRKHWTNMVKSYLAIDVLFHHGTMYEDAHRLEILLKQKTGHP